MNKYRKKLGSCDEILIHVKTAMLMVHYMALIILNIGVVKNEFHGNT